MHHKQFSENASKQSNSDTAKETKINNNHKHRNEFCFKKKTLHNEKMGIIVSWEIFSQ